MAVAELIEKMVSGIPQVALVVSNAELREKKDMEVHLNVAEKHNVQRLRFNKCNIGTEAVKALVEYLPKSAIQSLRITYCKSQDWTVALTLLLPALKAMRSLQKLDLHGNSLNYNAVKQLALFLNEDPKLGQLNLRNTSIIGEGASLIAENLQNNTELQVLYLGQNSICRRVAIQFQSMLKFQFTLMSLEVAKERESEQHGADTNSINSIFQKYLRRNWELARLEQLKQIEQGQEATLCLMLNFSTKLSSPLMRIVLEYLLQGIPENMLRNIMQSKEKKEPKEGMLGDGNQRQPFQKRRIASKPSAVPPPDFQTKSQMMEMAMACLNQSPELKTNEDKAREELVAKINEVKQAYDSPRLASQFRQGKEPLKQLKPLELGFKLHKERNLTPIVDYHLVEYNSDGGLKSFSSRAPNTQCSKPRASRPPGSKTFGSPTSA